MSKVTTLQRVQDLCVAQADAPSIDCFYDDVVFDLGRRPWLTQASLVATTANTAVYTPPTTLVRMIEVFYDDRVLRETSHRNLEAINAQWRDQRGTPAVYTLEKEDSFDFRVYPTPEINSKDFIFLFGAPFGLDFPVYAVAIVHTETRVDLPAWLELPVTFEVLHREFSRESDHQDMAFASACKELADLLFSLVA